VFFKQFLDEDLGCAAYLVGDERAGEAVVVDPPYAVEPVLDECEARGLRLTRVLETHTHADHVSGHGRLALELGVPVHVHPVADPDYPFEPLEDGGRIPVGDVVLTAMHTPGHRPEHCCFTITDTARAPEPWLVLTGDSLFVGDAARPDLAVEAREGAEGLYTSLRRLLQLADGVEVYPGHVAGSLCGTGMSSKGSTTIGFERRFNHMLGLHTLEDFIGESTAGAGLRPPNVEHVVALNRGPFVGSPAPLEDLDAPTGAVVLDVREPEEFAAGHVAGAINVPLSSSSFGTKAGFIFSPDEPIALYASSRGDAETAARRLRAVGLLDLAGVLHAGRETERLEPIEIEELERLLASDAVDVLDVREADERDGGYIPGSRHIPFRLIRALGENGPGRERPVVTICESGSRAAIAASILAASGADARPVLVGGIPAWESRGNAVIEFRRCGS
jgi:glyoxylase-like metal-dependent hydrolase (beta-lactamase superfamily II)